MTQQEWLAGQFEEHTLRSRRTRGEESLDVRLPDPIVDAADGTDPEHEALLADSIGLALQVVLETGLGRLRVHARRDIDHDVDRVRAGGRPGITMVCPTRRWTHSASQPTACGGSRARWNRIPRTISASGGSGAL